MFYFSLEKLSITDVPTFLDEETEVQRGSTVKGDSRIQNHALFDSTTNPYLSITDWIISGPQHLSKQSMVKALAVLRVINT